MIRVGMCPAPKDSDWEREANPHVSRLIEAVASKEIVIVPLATQDLADPIKAVSELRLDAIHFHWATSAFDLKALEHFPVPIFLHRALREIPVFRRFYKMILPVLRSCGNALAGRKVVAEYRRSIDAWISRLEGCGVPILWQQHDLLSHSSKGRNDFRSELDAYLHARLYKACDLILVHELSCLAPVFAFYGSPKPYAMVPIGRLSDCPEVPRAEARRRLGLPEGATVFAYAGSTRPNRTPQRSFASFVELARGDCFLLVAGKNAGKYLKVRPLPRNVIIIDRFLSGDEMRDVFCASDFVINDAEEYLTSGVVRSAMSYGVPVIARMYGSTADMARGALIEIGPRGLTEAMGRAAGLSAAARASLASEARARDRERSWAAAGTALRAAYERAVADTGNSGKRDRR